MDRFGDRVGCVEEGVRQLEAEKNFEKILERLKSASWSVPKGFSTGSVREDRDSPLTLMPL